MPVALRALAALQQTIVPEAPEMAVALEMAVAPIVMALALAATVMVEVAVAVPALKIEVAHVALEMALVLEMAAPLVPAMADQAPAQRVPDRPRVFP